MKNTEKAKLNAMLAEIEATQDEASSVYFKLEAGKSDIVTFNGYERINKQVNWGGEEQYVDTFRLHLIQDGEEKFFDRKFVHSFSSTVLKMILNEEIVKGQEIIIRKGNNRFGEYTVLTDGAEFKAREAANMVEALAEEDTEKFVLTKEGAENAAKALAEDEEEVEEKPKPKSRAKAKPK